MKTMKRILLLAATLIFGIKCSSPKVPTMPQGFEYTIVEDKLDKAFDRRTLRVRVNQEITEAEVKNLSDWLKDNRTDVNNMIIFYLLEGKNYVGNVWLRIDYDPEYKTELIATPKL